VSETYDYGPIQAYEVVWASGHVERIQAHQVTLPPDVPIFGSPVEARGPRRIMFHGQIDGKWQLVLSALEEDIRSIRLVTVDEPIPGGTP
jgi:hypothetical protein